MQPSIEVKRHNASEGVSLTVAQFLRALVIFALLLIGFPRHLSPEVGFLPFPITTLGVVMVNAAVLLSILLSSRLRAPGVALTLVGVAVAYMCVRGLMNYSHIEFRLYFFFREVLFLLSLVTGAMLGEYSAHRDVRRLAILLFVLSAALLMIHSVALVLRFGLTGRNLDPPLFAYASTIAVLMPFVATRWKSSFWIRVTLVGGIFSYCLFAAISGTRSILGFLAVAGAASLCVLVRSRSLGIAVALRFAAAVLCIVAVGVYFGMFDLVLDRLGGTMIADEVRIVEAKEVLAIAHEWWPWGYGIGVGLETSVGYEEGPDSRVNAPHIGILAWVIKAGWVGFVLLAAVVAGAFRSCLTGSLARLGFGLGVFVYMAISLVSGGWVPWELFLLGFCLTASKQAPPSASIPHGDEA